MNISGLRGIILEEVVLHLLELAGYRTVETGEEGTRVGHSGLEVQGRGEWHQIDALAALDHSPPFMYPIRLMVEAKCHATDKPVQIHVVRNAVGVLKDISENFFSATVRSSDGARIPTLRFNYQSAIFSSSGYTRGAIKYAIAHQIFLIQYKNVGLIQPVLSGIHTLVESHLRDPETAERKRSISTRIRETFRELIRLNGDVQPAVDGVLTTDGHRHLRDEVIRPLLDIRGSYFGTLQGRWPIHLIAKNPLPPAVFSETDEVPCKVFGRQGNRWSFAPSHIRETDENRWFRLDFDLPEEVVSILESSDRDAETVARIKEGHFSYADLSGKIGGINRRFRLKLDSDWMADYRRRLGVAS
ncbi:hypothetical protein [Silanimonas sp.]|jgi:hypothetical protein|uniref:hypothetical protein n=1 Tax=Silanimonas sp. TaxID=1929290 RepID=UPI0037CC3852